LEEKFISDKKTKGGRKERELLKGDTEKGENSLAGFFSESKEGAIRGGKSHREKGWKKKKEGNRSKRIRLLKGKNRESSVKRK